MDRSAVMFADGTKDRKADGVVAADAERARACGKDRSEAALDAAEWVFDAQWIDRQIAEVGGAMLRKRIHAENRIPRANDGRLIAHAARAESRSWPIGSAAI